MGYLLTMDQGDDVLKALRKDYRVYAPKRFPQEGRYSDTDMIRYAEVESFGDIVWDTKSDFPAKEVLSPIQQTLFYFTEEEFRASKDPQKPILLLARPCDIHAQEVQSRIYAGNGGVDGYYYERVRHFVTFAMMGGKGGGGHPFFFSLQR